VTKLLSELVRQGKIQSSKAQEIEAEVAKNKTTEEEVVLKYKLVGEDELFKLKGQVNNVPFLKPATQEIPLDILELISEEAAINYKMTPLFRKGTTVGIGMVYPENIDAQNALRFLVQKGGLKYEVSQITLSDLETILKQHSNLKRETKKALEQLSKEKSEILIALTKGSVAENISQDAPIVKMVLVILRHAIEGNASDIHIEPTKEKLNVRFRQDGVLHLSLFLPLNVHLAIVSRIKILANLKIDENRVPQDGRFSAKINNRDIDFRVATFPTLYGEKVEVRVLDPNEGLKSFDKMGLSKRNLEIIQTAIKKPYGLIISSGPTGSGKTTSLYAFLRILNKEGVNIVTIEDPIEYSIDGVNQSQVKPEIGYTFAEGLRQILRQDPNVIMVGEVRDEETASLVIHSALTGHIVLSTLHTNSATGVIPRLIDMGIKPFLIPSTLRLAISQRLIRTLCDNCKKRVKISEKVRAYIQKSLGGMSPSLRKEVGIPAQPEYMYEAQGCEQCNFKGYRGRNGIFEVLPMTEEIADIILKNPVENLILKAAQKQGMLTMAQEGVIKVLSGETTIDEIERATTEE